MTLQLLVWGNDKAYQSLWYRTILTCMALKGLAGGSLPVSYVPVQIDILSLRGVSDFN